MNTETKVKRKASTSVWIGRILSGLICVMFSFSAISKVVLPGEQAEEMLSHLGLDASLRSTLAVIEIICVIAYAVPQTAVVGAILLTGYMGGAIFAHLRVGDPPIIQVALPILAWLGIFLREPRLGELIPFRRKHET